MKKRFPVVILSILLVLVIVGVAFVAVRSVIKKKNNGELHDATPDSVVSGAQEAETIYSDHYKIGIVQTGLGSASKDCYSGFMLELDERNLLGNLDVTYVVEDNEELCRTKIKELLDGGCDLLYTIGRYASQTSAELTKDKPVVFAAVNSPDVVGLVESNEVPGGNVTGVSSYTPCFEQIDLIKTLMPNAKSVAVLYSGTDSEAVEQGIVAAREAENIGLTCTQFTIDDKASLESALSKIKDNKIETIYVPVDKFLSANIATVIDFSSENKIPVFCGDEMTLSQGALATSVINYESIGRVAAGMVHDILFDHTDISKLSVVYKHDCTNMVNADVKAKLGLEIPATALGEVEMWTPPTEPPTEAATPTTAEKKDAASKAE